MNRKKILSSFVLAGFMITMLGQNYAFSIKKSGKQDTLRAPNFDAEGATKEFYDTHADDYAKIWGEEDPELPPFLEKFITKIPREGKILDSGCGGGRDLFWFIKNNFKNVIGVDFSEKMIKLARRRKEIKDKVRVMDMKELSSNFPENNFDGIWNNAAFLHIPEKEAKKTIQGFYEILKPGGVLFLRVKEGKGEQFIDTGEYGETRFYKLYQKDELKKLLEDNGFEIADADIGINYEKKRGVNWVYVFARKPAVNNDFIKESILNRIKGIANEFSPEITAGKIDQLMERLRIHLGAEHFNELFTDETHGFAHTLEVLEIALKIIKSRSNARKIDMNILFYSILLHDIWAKRNNKEHAKKGAELATKLMFEPGFDDKMISGKIEQAIEQHNPKHIRTILDIIEGDMLCDVDFIVGTLNIERHTKISDDFNRQFFNNNLKPEDRLKVLNGTKDIRGEINDNLMFLLQSLLVGLQPEHYLADQAREYIRKEKTNLYKKVFNKIIKEVDERKGLDEADKIRIKQVINEVIAAYNTKISKGMKDNKLDAIKPKNPILKIKYLIKSL